MKLPIVALKNITMLPKLLLKFEISHPAARLALEKAMQQNRRIFITCLKNGDTETPEQKDLNCIGVISTVKQLVRTQDSVVQVLAEGGCRAELVHLSQREPYPEGEIEEAPYNMDVAQEVTEEAMLRLMRMQILRFGQIAPNFSEQQARQLAEIEDLQEMMDQLMIRLPVSMEERQALLDTESTFTRFHKLVAVLEREIDVSVMMAGIQKKVKEQLDDNQRTYVLREQLQAIKQELGQDIDGDIEEYTARCEALDAPETVKSRIRKEIGRLDGMPAGNHEETVLRTYIETVLEMPWNKMSEENSDMEQAKQVLEEDHYGLETVKERILEYLAVRSFTGQTGGSILCLVGPPGTGKTSVARSVARALGREYVRVCLGGVRDEAEIRGHRKTYVGAMPGRVAVGLKQAGVSNPLMVLDEIDKVSSDYKGDVFSALLEVLDAEQNCHFQDHYIELPLDLSRVLFIATANTTDTIPRPLLDRMEIIEISGYTENEKFHIAKHYLTGKQRKANGLTGRIVFSDEALRLIIHSYTREAGVRGLERRIGEICRKAAKELVETGKKSVRVSEKAVAKYLGKEQVSFRRARGEARVGVVTGLAWTAAGGDTLEIEVNLTPGDGALKLTGQLGDVMKESAQAGISYIRSAEEKYGIDGAFFSQHNIHLHIPEGAVPKDGPSAGITMATAVLSAVTGRSVRDDLAMTGEITIRGRVLPVGGLKEKLLAARLAEIRRVLVPFDNRKDVEELSEEIIGDMDICYVKSMEEVTSLCFGEGTR